ncbi:hypothetical protein SAMN05216344_12111 [Polaromonas sp. OV174]|nr:hypothetical protein SAMN05216344_12111 [Polaromonas sp. OV174]
MSIKIGAMLAAAAMVLGSTAAAAQQATANPTAQAEEGKLSPNWINASVPNGFTLVAAGDLIITEAVSPMMKRKSPDLIKLLQSADVSFACIRGVEIEKVVVLDCGLGLTLGLDIPDRLEKAACYQPTDEERKLIPALKDGAVVWVAEYVSEETIFHGRTSVNGRLRPEVELQFTTASDGGFNRSMQQVG